MRIAALVAAGLIVATSTSSEPEPPRVVLRLDDVGMNHAVNSAIRRVADSGIPISVSVLVVAPQYQEAVTLLRAHPEISVGVHLALNAEWKDYRWGPVLGRASVPTLVDSAGFFRSSSRAFLDSKYDLTEVERELGAQIDRALASGLKIDYVDYHMGTAVARPALRAIVERLAAKHRLGISRYFGETTRELWDVPIERKRDSLLTLVRTMPPGVLSLVVVHVAEATPEKNALVDLNAAEMTSPTGEPLSGRHRQAELDALLSPQFIAEVRQRSIRLLTYREVIATRGLQSMKAPGR